MLKLMKLMKCAGRKLELEATGNEKAGTRQRARDTIRAFEETEILTLPGYLQ
jgi:hypothetical protein